MDKPIFNKKTPFSNRSLTTFLLTFAALLMVVSSVVLFVLPHGRIAFWNDFRIWGLSKEQWEAIHVTGGILLLLSSIVHLYFNWKMLMTHIARQKLAMLLAFLATGVFFIGSAAEVPPFSTVMDLSESAKTSWKAEPPPVPHYEYRTLREISEQENTPLDTIVQKLEQAGIKDVDADDSLKTNAFRNEMTPAKLYEVMGGKKRRKPGQNKKKQNK